MHVITLTTGEAFAAALIATGLLALAVIAGVLVGEQRGYRAAVRNLRWRR